MRVLACRVPLFAVAAALVLQRSSVEGAPIATCAQQRDCMTWTADRGSNCWPAAKGECHEQFVVCVTIHPKSASRPNCPMREEGFDHYCKTVDCYASYPPEMGPKAPGAFPWLASSRSFAFQQCQYGGPGESLYFVFSDGQGCGGEGLDLKIPLCSTELDLACSPRPRNMKTCTEQGMMRSKECVWKVTLPPACQGCTEDTTTSPAGEDSMPPSIEGAIANPFEAIGKAADGGRIAAGAAISAPALALAGAVFAMAVSLLALRSCPRARAGAGARHAPLTEMALD